MSDQNTQQSNDQLESEGYRGKTCQWPDCDEAAADLVMGIEKESDPSEKMDAYLCDEHIAEVMPNGWSP